MYVYSRSSSAASASGALPASMALPCGALEAFSESQSEILVAHRRLWAIVPPNLEDGFATVLGACLRGSFGNELAAGLRLWLARIAQHLRPIARLLLRALWPERLSAGQTILF